MLTRVVLGPDGVWTDPKRRVSPAVVHFNGGGKLFMGEWFNVWRQWWYGGGGKQKRDHPDGRVWLNHNQSSVSAVCRTFWD